MPVLSLLISASALVEPPPVLVDPASLALLRSPTATRDESLMTRSFGVTLEPRYIFGADSLDQ